MSARALESARKVSVRAHRYETWVLSCNKVVFKERARTFLARRNLWGDARSMTIGRRLNNFELQ